MRTIAAKLAALVLALFALSALVVHASCTRGAPSAAPEPQAQTPAANPAAGKGVSSASAATDPAVDDSSDVYMGASKAGPMVRPHRATKTPSQQAAPPSNANPSKP